MTGRKKLSDLFIDAKLPAADRGRVPVLVDGLGPVWAAGFRPAQRARVGRETQTVLAAMVQSPGGDGFSV
jgi:tRNA(Ile)-lysidine synthase